MVPVSDQGVRNTSGNHLVAQGDEVCQRAAVEGYFRAWRETCISFGPRITVSKGCNEGLNVGVPALCNRFSRADLDIAAQNRVKPQVLFSFLGCDRGRRGV